MEFLEIFPLSNIYNIFSRYRHVNWALADQAMVSGVNFLTGILFARFLGIEEYGRFTLAWMAVLFFNSFQQAGIIAPMMSIGPKQEKENEAAYYGAVFIHQLIWSAGCSLLLWIGIFLSGFVKPEWHIQNLAVPLSTTLFAWQLQDFIRRYFFVRSKSNLAFLNDTVSYIGQILIFIILFQLNTLNSVQVLWVIAATSMVGVLVGLLGIAPICFPSKTMYLITKNHWHFSKWMLLSALTQWFSGNFFFVVAANIIGPVAVGGIKAAQNITGVINIVFSSSDMLIHSGAARSFFNGGISALKKYLSIVTVQGGTLTLFLISIIFVFSKFLLSYLYHTSFVEYSYIVRWFCVISLISYLGYPLAAGLRALERTKIIFYSTLLTSLLSIIIAKPLISNLQLTGVVLGFFIVKAIMVSVFIFDLSWSLFCYNKKTSTPELL